jgi:1-deoxy-D-xylulose 5-phosphate reductoisomerase
VTGSIGIHLDITENQEERIQLLSLIAEKNINAVITDEKGRLEG